MALVADMEHEKIDWLRIYHSLWPLKGGHEVRQPLLKAQDSLSLPPIVESYQNNLALGALDNIVCNFTSDGYAREPSGANFRYQGADKLREFYGMLFSNEGGVVLEHCSLTDDGKRSAIEYNVVKWGQSEVPPQAGVAIYDYNEHEKLTAARIYDDVDPPLNH